MRSEPDGIACILPKTPSPLASAAQLVGSNVAHFDTPANCLRQVTDSDVSE